ncbi:unnamed protein product [Rhodiola kirilowii]
MSAHIPISDIDIDLGSLPLDHQREHLVADGVLEDDEFSDSEDGAMYGSSEGEDEDEYDRGEDEEDDLGTSEGEDDTSDQSQ